jgi:hypothetical protein
MLCVSCRWLARLAPLPPPQHQHQMGGVFAKALGRLVGKKEMRILMVRATTTTCNQPCALCDPRPCVTACAQSRRPDTDRRLRTPVARCTLYPASRAQLSAPPRCHMSVGRPRCCRQDHHPLQAEARRDRDHHPDHRLQRRDCRVQEHLVHCVGCRGAGQDPAAVAPLLYVHVYGAHNAELRMAVASSFARGSPTSLFV